MKLLKRAVKKLLYGEKSDSDSYIKYLKKRGCNIGEGVYFYSPMTTVIDNVRMDWITIGSFTKITHGVVILAHDYSPSVCVHTHHNVVLAGGTYTTIGKNCFLGMNCIIMPGKHVGDNCIVGSGTVVVSDIPDNSVCAGNPAKVIMTMDQFNEKRKRSYLEDAKRNVRHFRDTHGRLPKTEELHGFSFLYLDKTSENWEKYFTNYLSKDNDIKDVKKAFFNTTKLFDSYNEFISFCLEDEDGNKKVNSKF